jgi:hypothetical protein
MGLRINARQQRYGKQLNKPKINARKQRHVSPLGNTLGETQGEGITPAHLGSPRLTSAVPDEGERCRPMLTRQNRKGNIEPSSPEFCPPKYLINQKALCTTPTLTFPLINLVAQIRTVMPTSKKSKTRAPPKMMA